MRQSKRGLAASARTTETVNLVVHRNHRRSQGNRAIRQSATDNLEPTICDRQFRVGVVPVRAASLAATAPQEVSDGGHEAH